MSTLLSVLINLSPPVGKWEAMDMLTPAGKKKASRGRSASSQESGFMGL